MLANMDKPVITIDGGVATGTSTLSRDVALVLNVPRINAGSIFRALAYEVLRQGVDPHDGDACVQLANKAQIDMPDGEVLAVNGEVVVKWIDGQRIDNLHTKEVDDIVPIVAAHPGVKRAVWEYERRFAAQRGAVADGRETGTMVFPDATMKLFLVCDNAIAAVRRSNADGREVSVQEIIDRNEADKHHEVGALIKADGAIEIDTSYISVAELVPLIVELLNMPSQDRPKLIRRAGPTAQIERL